MTVRPDCRKRLQAKHQLIRLDIVEADLVGEQREQHLHEVLLRAAENQRVGIGELGWRSVRRVGRRRLDSK